MREVICVNSRDRAYTIRELTAWGWWIRAGRTWPNRLGYKPVTVEHRIMNQIPGGGGIGGSVVPSKFNIDRNVERVDFIVLKLPDPQLMAISGVYVRGMSQRDLAGKLKISRGKLRHDLEKVYVVVYDGIK